MDTGAHPRDQLSAYLDGALGPADRQAVETHLAACADCRTRHAELRATASLLRSLPDPVPGRRLVPRLATPPAWLAPLRTLATMASGVSVFLFIASALAMNLTSLATPSALNAPAAGGGAALAPASGVPERGAAAAPGQATPRADVTTDAVKQQASASPGLNFSVASAAPADARASTSSAEREASRSYGPALVTNPWSWLALAVISGAAALVLQRRLRRA